MTNQHFRHQYIRSVLTESMRKMSFQLSFDSILLHLDWNRILHLHAHKWMNEKTNNGRNNPLSKRNQVKYEFSIDFLFGWTSFRTVFRIQWTNKRIAKLFSRVDEIPAINTDPHIITSWTLNLLMQSQWIAVHRAYGLRTIKSHPIKFHLNFSEIAMWLSIPF